MNQGTRTKKTQKLIKLIEDAYTFEGLYRLAKYWLNENVSLESVLKLTKELDIPVRGYNTAKDIACHIWKDIYFVDLILHDIASEIFHRSLGPLASASEFNAVSASDADDPEDIKKNKKHIRLLAELGLPQYQFDYAMIKIGEIETNNDAEKVCHLLEKAIAQGSIEAQYVLSVFYLTGIGVNKDFEKGVKLLKEAASNHMFDAIFTIMQLRGDQFSNEYYIKHLEMLDEWCCTIDWDRLLGAAGGSDPEIVYSGVASRDNLKTIPRNIYRYFYSLVGDRLCAYATGEEDSCVGLKLIELYRE